MAAPKQGIIHAWHNISGNAPKIVPPLTTLNDLDSIIQNMANEFDLQLWLDSIDLVYKHIADLHNPHQLTIDQLPTSVADAVYALWLGSGYRGTRQEMFDQIFRYIPYASMEEMRAGSTDQAVPPVKVFMDYIREHNAQLTEAHVEKMESIFYGSPIDSEPSLVFSHLAGLPRNIVSHWNAPVRRYENLDIGEQWNPLQGTLLLGVRSRTQPGTLNLAYLAASPTLGWWFQNNPNSLDLTVFLSAKLTGGFYHTHTFLDPNDAATYVLSYSLDPRDPAKNRIWCGSQDRLQYFEPGANVDILSPTYLSFMELTETDWLRSFVYYPRFVTGDKLKFLSGLRF